MTRRPDERLVDFGLLGPLEVRTAEGPLRVTGTKARALLARLALDANRVVPRDRLVDDLWGDHPPATVAKAVQVYVSQWRKLLPQGTLVTRPPGYVILADPESVDALRFERRIRDARSLEPEEASAVLAEALGEWRGSPLAEFANEPFARIERRRLEELRQVALEEQIEAELALGRHAKVVGELEALIAASPQRERLWGQLMLALYRSGRQSDALMAFREARAALGELGLEPNRSLQQLERRILLQDPALDLRHARPATDRLPLPGALVPVPPFPFVGRERELETLRSLLGRAETGEGGVVLLGARAGGGKTRLIRELAQETAAKGTLVLYGVSDAVVATPYQPLREWLEFLLRALPPEAADDCFQGSREVLSALVPRLAPAGSAPASPDRYVLQSAAAQVLRRVCARQPVLMVADDLHWADEETLHLLRRLATAAPEERLLLVVGFRDRDEPLRPETIGALAELSRLEGATRLSLDRLSAADVHDFIELATNAEAPAALVSEIDELTDGTPLMLSELWRDLVDSGAVSVWGNVLHVSRAVAELKGSERIRDLVRYRVSRLGTTTASLLEAASVAGPHFELRTLAEATGLDREPFVASLDEAVRNGILDPFPEPAGAYRFTHELVRRAIYDRISAIRRSELHLRVGEALERLHAPGLARFLPELAHHFTQAIPLVAPERAVDYNVRAAEAAFASTAAAEHLGRAASLLPPDSLERLEILRHLTYAVDQTGHMLEARELARELYERATALGERALAAHGRSYATPHPFFDQSADPNEAKAAFEELIETFTELGDDVGLAAAMRRLALVHRTLGQHQLSADWLEKALELAVASDDVATRRSVVYSLANELGALPTPVIDGIARCRQLLSSCAGDPVLEAGVARHLSLLLAMAGRFDEAEECARAAGQVLDEAGWESLSWGSMGAVGHAKVLAGDLAGAEEVFRRKWRIYPVESGKTQRRAIDSSRDLVNVLCDQGRWDEAEECAAAHRPELPESVRALRVEARLAAHRGRLEEALRLARLAVDNANASDSLNGRAAAWVTSAEVQRAAGLDAEADASLERAILLYEQRGNVAAAARARRARSRLPLTG